MSSINTFNRINSISKDYMKIEDIFLSAPKNKTFFINHVMQFQKTEIERNAIHKVLSLLDNDVQAQYEQLVTSLSSNTLATTAQPTKDSSAITYDPPSSNPLYNAAKQAWAHNVLADFLNVVTEAKAKAATISQNETDLKALTNLSSVLTALVNKAKDGELSQENFETFYLLPDQIFSAIQSFPFEGNQKVLFSNQLLAAFGEDGSIEQIFADIRIEGLQDVLNIVQSKLSPEEFESFQELQTVIDTLREYVEPFDAEGFNTILQVSEALSVAIIKTSLPSNEKIELCRDIADFYKDQVLSIQHLDTVLNETIYINARHNSLFAEIASLVAFIMGSFAPVGLNATSIEVTNASIAGALQAVRAIDARFHELSPDQQQLVNETVAKLNDFHGGEYIGAVWAYFIAATTIASKNSVSPDEIKQVLTAQANTIASSFSLTQTLKTTINNIVAKNGQFETVVDGVDRQYTIFSSDSNNQAVLNPILLNFGSIGFLPNITEAANTHSETSARAFFRFKALAQTENAKLDATLQGSEDFLKKINQLRKDLFSYQLLAQSHEIRSLPLPAAVASVLIDRYMPKEIDYLTQMKSDLYYSNLGSSVGNAMIEAISQFVNGSTYFNFASFAGQQPMTGMHTDTFPGSQETAAAKLALEKQQTKLFIQYTNQALAVVQQQLARVKNDPVITNEQRLRILDALNSYADNLNSINGSLVLLQVYLNPLSVGVRDGNQGGGDTGKDPEGTFHVFGGQEQWQARLETLEDALVSGLPSNIINGGLFPVQATVQADQQAFADMGQNYQLEMQMHMTAMQQEWTVVATSLQILNQIYLGLSRKFAG
ncbi:CT620/CT621 family type III secretion system effector [Chlamydia muridarum]|uniref:CT620/CT621 family type III secretion system effector n=1 Tax=Chlamydia muridarum TaxID=83560 RepID=UPI00197F07C3|nr:CT620/CT621 family type III secretion system effector [Chlamydia muridarum]